MSNMLSIMLTCLLNISQVMQLGNLAYVLYFSTVRYAELGFFPLTTNIFLDEPIIISPFSGKKNAELILTNPLSFSFNLGNQLL